MAAGAGASPRDGRWSTHARARWARARLGAASLVGASLACGGLASDGPLVADRDEADPGESPGASGGAGGSGAGSNDGLPFGPRRETCEDNPLLAGCPSAGQAGSSTSGLTCDPLLPGCRPEAPAPDLEGSPLRLQAAQILASLCGDCHTPGSPYGGGPIDIRDLDRLMREGYIEACSPDSSPLITALREMPMEPIPEALIAQVVAAIEEGCTPEQRL